MADEISFSASLSINRNGVVTAGSGSKSVTQVGADYKHGTQLIGTSAELLDKGDIGTVGYVFVKNLDATNFVELALDSGATQIFAKLLPNEFAVVPTRQQYYARANTAACSCLVTIFEE